MMKMGTMSCAAVAVSSLIASAGWAAPVGSLQAPALAQFTKANPQSGMYQTGDRVTTVYGSAFAFGDSAIETANSFIVQHAGMFGVEAGELIPGSLAGDNAHVREKMFNKETGQFKFSLVSFLQARDGVPVFRSDLRLLVRNEPGYPLVLARSAMFDLGDFQVPQGATAGVGAQLAQNNVALKYMGMVNFTEPTLTIWAGYDDKPALQPKLAVTFIGTAFDASDPRYQRRLFVADVATGEILFEESQILHVDVSGKIQGMATPGKKADICETEILTPLPYARAAIGATAVFADKDGNFTIPNGGATPVTVNSEIAGRWFRTHIGSSGGAVAEAQSQNVTPPGPANFTFNAANNNATFRSGVNAYIQSNIVRDYTLKYAPTYPVIGNQQNWPVNVELADSCNAFYDGTSINFFNAQGGCPSTAFGDVVHHEYGHHLVQVAGSGQGQYGEGMGDVMGILISDNPVLGFGFQSNCNSGIRSALNGVNNKYPCNNAIHTCGQLISGCVWETRNELIITNPSTYRDIISELAINAIDLHTGDLITPQITIDFLTLDDDDANINNGTPHYNEINKGFTEHNMPAPALQLLTFAYPQGKPEFATPGQLTPFPVNVSGLVGTPIAGTAKLVYKINQAALFTSVNMTENGPNQYIANLPATNCGDVITWYVQANANPGNQISTDPLNAPAGAFVSVVAASTTPFFTDDFQTNKNWVSGATGDTATTGKWNRMDPQPTDAQPGDDHTPAPGTICWVTDGTAGSGIGANDVDGGKTTLLTPIFNLSGKEAVNISYWRWYSNTKGGAPNADTFRVDISNNGGTSWTSVEIVGPSGPQADGGWFFKTLNPASFVPLTANMQMRFIAEDIGEGSIVEAAIDDFLISDLGCNAAGCYADCDSSGSLSIDDFICFQTLFAIGDPTADCDGSGGLNIDDFICFQTTFAIGC